MFHHFRNYFFNQKYFLYYNILIINLSYINNLAFSAKCSAYNTNHVTALSITNAGRIRNTYLSIYRTISALNPWTITGHGRVGIQYIIPFRNLEGIWTICCCGIYGWDNKNILVLDWELIMFLFIFVAEAASICTHLLVNKISLKDKKETI